MKFVALLCLMGSAAVSVAGVIDLDKSATLESVFEGGLRPLQVWGQEGELCEVRPAQTAQIKIADRILPPLFAVWDFKIKESGRFASLTARTESPWGGAEAIEFATPLEEALGGDPAQMRKFLEGYPGTSVNGDMWGRSYFNEAKTIKVSYYFRHSMNDPKPFLLTFRVEWWDVIFKGGGYSTIPLKPPPGYENFDMRPIGLQMRERQEKEQREGLVNVGSRAPSKRRGNDSAGQDISTGVNWWWLLIILLLPVGRWLDRRYFRRCGRKK